MIVRSDASAVQLITQPDHARAARTIMERCAPLASHPRCGVILDAIEQHDNGWREVDAAPAVNPATGAIFDFVSIPVPVRQAIWPRGVQRLAGDPWAAALVAHHALVVYDRYRTDPAWASFFAEMTASRDAMERAAALSHEALVGDYPFLRMADLMSLAFCTRAEEGQEFGGWTVRRSDSHVLVSPDLFGGSLVPFDVPAVEIRPGPYESDADLHAAVAAGRRIMLRGDVSGSAPRGAKH